MMDSESGVRTSKSRVEAQFFRAGIEVLGVKRDCFPGSLLGKYDIPVIVMLCHIVLHKEWWN